MTSKATTVDQYIAELPDDRNEAISKLREVAKKNLEKNFKEEMSYGMIGYVVPHTLYPKGYHCKPALPLPFINIASQKNFIAIYHMGLYSSGDLLTWFQAEWPKHTSAKLDMGKSCIRFKKPELIPYKLFGELFKKMTAKEWIAAYESLYVNKK